MLGKKLKDRYELLEQIGGGGMAVVYKAKDELLNRYVAIKILRAEFVSDDDFVRRFRREAQSAASLSHPNIVSIYDIGIEDDTHFIIMEYVQGKTLKEIINEQAPLPVEQAIDITQQIAEALDHAHQHEIIHRDIKPHNILINQWNRAKVTDFGIARAVSSATITHTGSVMGSVHYFSPEQARGGMTGEKSDIYSLGIVLYEMVTGVLPFSGESPISVALKHLQESFTDPRNINPNIPQSVENIITRSLAKDVDQRYTSAHELIDDLQSCLHPQRLTEAKYELTDDDEEATKVIPAIEENMVEPSENPHRPPAENDTQEHEQENSEKKRKMPRWAKISIVVLLVLLLGFGTYQGYQFVSDLFYVEDVEVADILELPVDEAVQTLEESGLVVDEDIVERHSQEVEEGHVLRQDPAGGRTVKEGSTVSLTVSLGPEMVQTPSVVGTSRDYALRMLANADIPDENIEIVEEHSTDVREDQVIRQSPEAQEEIIPEETEVQIVISLGPETFSMPDLIGLSEAEAESEINRSGLVLEDVEYEHHDKPEGTVFRQYPFDPGQEVELGQSIILWVSEGPEVIEQDRTESITIDPDEVEDRPGNSPIDIQIEVDDIHGEREAVQTEIQEEETFDIDVTVSNEQSATITIIMEEETKEEIEVQYEE